MYTNVGDQRKESFSQNVLEKEFIQFMKNK